MAQQHQSAETVTETIKEKLERISQDAISRNLIPGYEGGQLESVIEPVRKLIAQLKQGVPVSELDDLGDALKTFKDILGDKKLATNTMLQKIMNGTELDNNGDLIGSLLLNLAYPDETIKRFFGGKDQYGGRNFDIDRFAPRTLLRVVNEINKFLVEASALMPPGYEPTQQGFASLKYLVAKHNDGKSVPRGAQVAIVPYKLSCLLYTSPSPRDKRQSRMPSSA